MAYFYQIDRVNLTRKVHEYEDHIVGKTLDVGAGENQRYAFPKATEYIRMNTDMDQDFPGGPKTDVVGTAEAIPFPDGSIDSIVCTQVLIDVLEPMLAFKEFSRVLKKGGKVLLTTSFLIDRQDSTYQSWSPTDHALRKLSEANGMKVIVVEGCGAFYSAMFQLVTRYLLRRHGLKQSRFARIYSAIFARIGRFCIWLDSRQTPEMKKHFTDSWILVAERL